MYKNILLMHDRTFSLLNPLLLKNCFLHCLTHYLIFWSLYLFWRSRTFIWHIQLRRVLVLFCLLPMILSLKSPEAVREITVEEALFRLHKMGEQVSDLASDLPVHCPDSIPTRKHIYLGSTLDKTGSGFWNFWAPRGLANCTQSLVKSHDSSDKTNSIVKMLK